MRETCQELYCRVIVMSPADNKTGGAKRDQRAVFFIPPRLFPRAVAPGKMVKVHQIVQRNGKRGYRTIVSFQQRCFEGTATAK